MGDILRQKMIIDKTLIMEFINKQSLSNEEIRDKASKLAYLTYNKAKSIKARNRYTDDLYEFAKEVRQTNNLIHKPKARWEE